MDAKELRIGNLVLADVGLPSMQTHKIMAEDIVDCHNGILKDKIKPIPLTEEWLLKFGFKKNENGFFNLINNSEVEILIKDGYWTCDGIVFSLFNFEYVHQLQNLYFALMGEELL